MLKKKKIKRKLKSDSSIRSKSRKVEKSTVKVHETGSDNEQKNKTKSVNSSSDFNKSGCSAFSSKVYAPIRNRKLKPKKSKGSSDSSEISSLLALDSSQEGAIRDEPEGDILKELDDFINE